MQELLVPDPNYFPFYWVTSLFFQRILWLFCRSTISPVDRETGGKRVSAVTSTTQGMCLPVTVRSRRCPSRRPWKPTTGLPAPAWQRPLLPLVLGRRNQGWQRLVRAEILHLGLASAMTQMGAARWRYCSCPPGPGGTGTTLGDFKGRASLNAHLRGVSCFFPKPMLRRVICGSAGWAWIKAGRGHCCFRAAAATEWPEGQIFLPELAIEVGFMPFNLRETWASPVMGDIWMLFSPLIWWTEFSSGGRPLVPSKMEWTGGCA